MDPGTKIGAVSACVDKIIDTLHAADRKVILISSYLPYDVARYPMADAVLVTCSSFPMNELPAEGQTYNPALPAALCAVFGEFEPEGTMPVRIPEMDEHYHFIMKAE